MVYRAVQGSHSAVQSVYCTASRLGVYTNNNISVSPARINSQDTGDQTERERERERGIIIKYKQSDSDLNIVSGNLHKVIPTRATSSRKM